MSVATPTKCHAGQTRPLGGDRPPRSRTTFSHVVKGLSMSDRAAAQRVVLSDQRKRPLESLPMLLDGSGVARHLGITERHVRRLVSERRIPFVKLVGSCDSTRLPLPVGSNEQR